MDDLLTAFRDAVRAKIKRDMAAEEARAAELRAEVIPAVRGAIAEARRRGLCRRAWLFGSYAWGKPGERSDVDVLVEGEGDSEGLAARIGRACHMDAVHVIDLKEAPESLRDRVLRDGLEL